MSMESLLVAVAQRVRSALKYATGECDVQPDGHPPASMGQRYLAIHPGPIQQSDDNALRMHEAFEIVATLTMRGSWLPRDRQGRLVRDEGRLYPEALRVRALLHMDYTLIDTANDDIGASEDGFIVPLRFRGMGRPIECGPEWFGSEQKARPAAPQGWRIEIAFWGAERVQKIEEMS
jgi:hypothetical protein